MMTCDGSDVGCLSKKENASRSPWFWLLTVRVAASVKVGTSTLRPPELGVEVTSPHVQETFATVACGGRSKMYVPAPVVGSSSRCWMFHALAASGKSVVGLSP